MRREGGPLNVKDVRKTTTRGLPHQPLWWLGLAVFPVSELRWTSLAHDLLLTHRQVAQGIGQGCGQNRNRRRLVSYRCAPGF